MNEFASSPLRAALPGHVALCEVGPRDGFQSVATFIPTDLKLALIGRLAEAGLRQIQVASFVHPKWMPQMADAEAVCARLPPHDGVTYTGLALNPRGLERAHRAGLRHVELSVAVNDQQSRVNTNRPLDEALRQGLAMVEQAHTYGMETQVNFQTVFGYAEPGDTPLARVLEWAERFAGMGIASLSLGDTAGLAHPLMIRTYAQAVQKTLGEIPLVLHLHDTRGLGLANVVAALECGVTHFDTALAGMGGCPFTPGAAGNIATEDTVYLLESMGITTGVELERVAAASQQIEAFLGTSFPGKLHRLLQQEREMGTASAGT